MVDEDSWDANVASVGCQLLTLAMHQGILRPTDLEGLRLGEAFTIPDLVHRRKDTEGADASELANEVNNMCASPTTHPVCRMRVGWYVVCIGCMWTLNYVRLTCMLHSIV